MTFLEIFGEVPDPRDCTAQHALPDILFVALAAVLCGATHCTEMALFAQNRLALLRQFIPSSTARPAMTPSAGFWPPSIRPPSTTPSCASWPPSARRRAATVRTATWPSSFDKLRMRGKSLRRAYAKGCAHMPPLVVTVFGCDTFLSLAQAVSGAGGEAEAALEALKLVSLKGATVTGDALHCHRRMTRTIRARGGDYVLAIKGNQSKLAREAKAALDRAAARPRTRFHQTEADGHGRHEVRRAFVTPFAQTAGKNALVALRAVGRVESWRTVNGKTTHTVRCDALSATMPAETLLAVVRRHWSIENGLHWHLDVLLGEDQVRGRKNNAPANQALLRRLALNVLRADPEQIPLSHKRLKARWTDQDLLGLITHLR